MILYIDPGTGSAIIQFLVAAVSGALFFFSQIRTKVKKVYFKVFKNKNND